MQIPKISYLNSIPMYGDIKKEISSKQNHYVNNPAYLNMHPDAISNRLLAIKRNNPWDKPPIKNDKELIETWEKLKQGIYFIDGWDTPKDYYLKGIMPYIYHVKDDCVNLDDIHVEINSFLDGSYDLSCANKDELDAISDYSRILEYSLKKLREKDEKYKFSGWAYRAGEFDSRNWDKRFTSLSSDSNFIPLNYCCYKDAIPLNMIYVDNACNIYEICKKEGLLELNKEAEKEHELIIIPGENKYEKLSPENYDDSVQEIMNLWDETNDFMDIYDIVLKGNFRVLVPQKYKEKYIK